VIVGAVEQVRRPGEALAVDDLRGPCGSSLAAVWDVACTPGVSSSKAVKRRFRIGRLATVFSVKVVAIAALRFQEGVPARPRLSRQLAELA
jgi:hypothetical protein